MEFNLSELSVKIISIKYDIPNDNINKLDTYYHDIDEAIKSVA